MNKPPRDGSGRGPVHPSAPNVVNTQHPSPTSTEQHPETAWSIVERDDGSMQWAFRGKLLYTWTKHYSPAVLPQNPGNRQQYQERRRTPFPPRLDRYC